jgi:hypothetical protein
MLFSDNARVVLCLDTSLDQEVEIDVSFSVVLDADGIVASHE